MIELLVVLLIASPIFIYLALIKYQRYREHRSQFIYLKMSLEDICCGELRFTDEFLWHVSETPEKMLEFLHILKRNLDKAWCMLLDQHLGAQRAEGHSQHDRQQAR